jgi:hypothetical protein
LHDQPFRVSKVQIGYAYRLSLGGPFTLAIGGSASAFTTQSALDAAYSRHPWGGALFARLGLGH